MQYSTVQCSTVCEHSQIISVVVLGLGYLRCLGTKYSPLCGITHTEVALAERGLRARDRGRGGREGRVEGEGEGEQEEGEGSACYLRITRVE